MTPHRNGSVAKSTLHIYLLPSIDFEIGLALQRYMHYEITGNRAHGALILCEHPSVVTIGREGSSSHIMCEPEELQARQWRVQWVNRGGGCHLHAPGQLAVYPILPLDQLGLSIPVYLERLQQVVVDVLRDFSIHGATRSNQPGVWIGSRPVANVGVAVHDWVTYFGVYVNVNPAFGPVSVDPDRRIHRPTHDVDGKGTAWSRQSVDGPSAIR